MAAKPLFLCEDGSIVEDERECRGRVVDVLDGVLRVRVSKRLSGVLRHFPERYGIVLDRRGWAGLGEVVEALRRDFPWLREWHVRGIVLYDPKGRFEVSGGRIRARYGHSVDVSVEPLPGRPPRVLYHGTSYHNLPSIMRRGIVPMKRRLVHLTSSFEDAVDVGRRHGRVVVVFTVDTECLEERGLRVYRAGRNVYTVEWVPWECVRGYRVVSPGS